MPEIEKIQKQLDDARSYSEEQRKEMQREIERLEEELSLETNIFLKGPFQQMGYAADTAIVETKE